MRLRGWSHDSSNKSKMAAAAIFNFGKNINNSGMDEDICTKFHEIMHQGHAYNLCKISLSSPQLLTFIKN